MRTLIVVACLAVAPSAQAATFYFVGSPYEVVNRPSGDRPLFTTGYMTVDPSIVAGGSFFDHPAVTSGSNVYRADGFEAAFSVPVMTQELEVQLTFNAGKIADWHFGSPHDVQGYLNTSWIEWSGIQWQGQSDEIYDAVSHGFDWPDSARDFYSNPAHWIADVYASGPGQWFDSYLDASLAIQRNTELALANPAKSYYDIAPIPLPAAGWMMVVGLAGLGWVRARR